MNEAAALVQVSSLTRHFLTGAETLEVLRGVDLQVRQGETVAITGESGCGKSTLLGLIGGLDRPTGGALSVGGIDIALLDESELSVYRNRDVGFIFQFHFLLKDFTALENVVIPGMMSGQSTRALRDRARRLLSEVGLQGRMDAWPLELSGGERQRVAVARALINEPGLLLADEPTGNLDTARSREIMELLTRLNRELGITVIMVTHEPDMAAYATRIIRFMDGLVASDQPNGRESL
jgi:putative ABC transport system ATP-binding protein